MTQQAQWFGTPGGTFFHALDFGPHSNYAVCHRGIVLDQGDPFIDGVERVSRKHRAKCSKCVKRLEILAEMQARRSTRLTASQTWEKLSPLQREALLGWVLGSYAPSTFAQRYPLVKSETMTRAACVISQHWKGATT